MSKRGTCQNGVWIVVTVIMLWSLPTESVQAFSGVTNSVNTRLYHSYDGLECYDCHTIHNSENGAIVVNGGSEPYAHLLAQPTATDLCLGCHTYPASSIFKAPTVMTISGTKPATVAMPSGDFYWSLVDPGKGHNPGKSEGVQSPLMISDSTLSEAPGGTYSTEDWDCTSCHDPHDRFGADVSAWRQLKRKVNGIVVTGNETVAFGVESDGGDQGATEPGFEPILANSRGDIRGGANDTSYVNTRADGNPIEGADLFRAESDTNKNVYRGGFSSFCAACHGDFHGGNGEAETVANANTNPDGDGRWTRHPSNVVMLDKNSGGPASRKYGISTYTAAVTNAQGTSPNPVGYDWRYPLVQPDADFTVSRTLAAMTNPATALGDSRIMCLTCHRAHSSQFENMTRWDATGHAFIADGEVDFNGQPSSGDNPAYGCGKCHQKGGTTAFVKTF